MKKINKFILTKDQIDVIRTVHNQLIMDGLVDVGLKKEVEEEILKNSNENFESMIKQAQRILTEKGVMDQIREEILLEEKMERVAVKKQDKKTKK